MNKKQRNKAYNECAKKSNLSIMLLHNTCFNTTFRCRVFSKMCAKNMEREKNRVEKFRAEDDGVDRDLTKFFVPVQYRAINRR